MDILKLVASKNSLALSLSLTLTLSLSINKFTWMSIEHSLLIIIIIKLKWPSTIIIINKNRMLFLVAGKKFWNAALVLFQEQFLLISFIIIGSFLIDVLRPMPGPGSAEPGQSLTDWNDWKIISAGNEKKWKKNYFADFFFFSARHSKIWLMIIQYWFKFELRFRLETNAVDGKKGALGKRFRKHWNDISNHNQGNL